MLLHQTGATQRFLSTLTMFDLTLTPRGIWRWSTCQNRLGQAPLRSVNSGEQAAAFSINCSIMVFEA